MTMILVSGHLGVVGVMVWKLRQLASELISTKWMALWQSSTTSATSLTPFSYPCISSTGLNSSSWMAKLHLTMFASSLYNYGRPEWLKWTGLNLPWPKSQRKSMGSAEHMYWNLSTWTPEPCWVEGCRSWRTDCDTSTVHKYFNEQYETSISSCDWL